MQDGKKCARECQLFLDPPWLMTTPVFDRPPCLSFQDLISLQSIFSFQCHLGPPLAILLIFSDNFSFLFFSSTALFNDFSCQVDGISDSLNTIIPWYHSDNLGSQLREWCLELNTGAGFLLFLYLVSSSFNRDHNRAYSRRLLWWSFNELKHEECIEW